MFGFLVEAAFGAGWGPPLTLRPGPVRAPRVPLWDRLTQSGALTRLLGRADSSTLVRNALAVLSALPAAGRRAEW